MFKKVSNKKLLKRETLVHLDFYFSFAWHENSCIYNSIYLKQEL